MLSRGTPPRPWQRTLIPVPARGSDSHRHLHGLHMVHRLHAVIVHGRESELVDVILVRPCCILLACLVNSEDFRSRISHSRGADTVMPLHTIAAIAVVPSNFSINACAASSAISGINGTTVYYCYVFHLLLRVVLTLLIVLKLVPVDHPCCCECCRSRALVVNRTAA